MSIRCIQVNDLAVRVAYRMGFAKLRVFVMLLTLLKKFIVYVS